MKPKLVIGNKNYSSWSLRSWLILQKIEIDYDEIVIPLYNDSHHNELLAHSPTGLVPLFIDGDFVVWDSLAIAEYLAESHRLLWPDESRVRGHARAICAECHSGFAGVRNTMPMNCRASDRSVTIRKDLQSEINRLDAMWTECRDQYCVDGPWLYGRFSIADAFYAPIVSRFQTYGVSGLSDESKGYCRHILADPAMRQWYEAARAEPWTIAAFEVGVV